MVGFYNFLIVLGLIGTAWFAYLLWTFSAPIWMWVVSVIALLFVEFGCFAARDKRHSEAANKGTAPDA